MCRAGSEAIRDDQWQTVKTRGSQFVVGDRPFYVNGFNAYWLMILAADPVDQGQGHRGLPAGGGGRPHGVPHLGLQRRWVEGASEVTCCL